MESITFKSRQQFLSEFFNKDRVDFLSGFNHCRVIGDFLHYISDDIYSIKNIFLIETTVTFKKSNISFENYHKFLNSFLYFLYSYTRHEKFLKGSILKLEYLRILCLNNSKKIQKNIAFKPTYEGLNFLNKIKINESMKDINFILINLKTSYKNINNEDFLSLCDIFEERERERQREEERRQEERRQRRQRREREREEKIVNSSQCFKSEKCVICLTDPPNVLFCNCGHICFCLECEKLKNSNLCPICKINNKIIRVLN